MRFGSLTVISCTGRKSQAGNLIWSTVCDCGEARDEDGRNLRCGNVTSCRSCGRSRTTLASITHGASSSAEHRIWRGIKTRCLNPKTACYKNYGQRGITICTRWAESFTAFMEDMGSRPSPQHSVERKDNDGPYSPENCVWATAKDQALNRRTNRILTVGGVSKPVGVWAKEKGVPYDTLLARIRYGIEDHLLFTIGSLKKVR